MKNITISKIPLLILSLTVIVSGCISQKKLEYLYDSTKSAAEFNTGKTEVPRIRPGDELYIRVSSFDESTYNFFGTQAEGRALNYPNEIALSLITYSVNDSGCIHFPVLGRVYLEGKNIEEANDTLQTLLSEYFRQPNVIVSFVLKKIAVLGEVRSPGYFTYTNSSINIFQALGMAGDITILGNKRTVLVIRTNESRITKHYVDLTKDSIFQSDYYFLEPKDVVFVAPAKARQWSISSIPYELVITSITTLILLLNYFNHN